MGSKAIGADLNYAWPTSQIAVLGAAGAVNIIHRKDLQKAKDAGRDVEAVRAKYIAEYEETTVNANLSMEIGQVDAMIDPEQTREVLVDSLKTLASKRRVSRTGKHHATSRSRSGPACRVIHTRPCAFVDAREKLSTIHIRRTHP